MIEVAPLAFMRGRSQPMSTPVLTPTGFRPIGSLQVGDLVVGSDGRPTPVVGVYPQGLKPIVRLTAQDGASTLCCTEHLWHVYTRLRSQAREAGTGLGSAGDGGSPALVSSASVRIADAVRSSQVSCAGGAARSIRARAALGGRLHYDQDHLLVQHRRPRTRTRARRVAGRDRNRVASHGHARLHATPRPWASGRGDRRQPGHHRGAGARARRRELRYQIHTRGLPSQRGGRAHCRASGSARYRRRPGHQPGRTCRIQYRPARRRLRDDVAYLVARSEASPTPDGR